MAVLEVSERHQELVDELIETVEGYKPDLDRDLLTRAFSFAARAHDGQQRRSGEEFINHPLGVAKILVVRRREGFEHAFESRWIRLRPTRVGIVAEA